MRSEISRPGCASDPDESPNESSVVSSDAELVDLNTERRRKRLARRASPKRKASPPVKRKASLPRARKMPAAPKAHRRLGLIVPAALVAGIMLGITATFGAQLSVCGSLTTR